MVIGRINGVVGLTGLSDKKMTGCLVGEKSGRINEVVVRRGFTVQHSHSYLIICLNSAVFQSVL